AERQQARLGLESRVGHNSRPRSHTACRQRRDLHDGEWSVAYAVNARTGQLLWTYDPKVPRARARNICCDVVNRGVALYHGKVYVGTLDGQLIALDAKSGTPAWNINTIDQSKPYAITGAPRIAKGMVLIGNAGAEY